MQGYLQGYKIATIEKVEAQKANALELIGNKGEEYQLVLERCRIKEVARQEEERHPIHTEECPICMEPVRVDIIDGVARLLCCGKFTCEPCYKLDKLTKCPLCRADFPTSDEDFIAAITALTDNGVAWALHMMGAMVEHGHYSHKVDKQQALVWYRRAAEQGVSWSMDRLVEYPVGEDINNGITLSVSEWTRWLKAAAAKGVANAQLILGTMYYEGEDGVAKNMVEAVRLLTLLLAKDPHFKNPRTCWVCYYIGQNFKGGSGGLDMSLERAKFYFTKALPQLADISSGAIQLFLAETLLKLSKRTYFDRITVPGHNCIPKVRNLLRIAQENGHSEAAVTIRDLESQQRDYCSACQRGAEDLIIEKLKRCTRCKAVWYCGRECQLKDWKLGHKVDCCKSI
eukprot:scaffold173826_cov62-Attheya_sp.AAC.3